MPTPPPTQSQFVARLRDAMRVADPEMDTSVGTYTRKVFDVVGEVVAESAVDVYNLRYARDITARSGAALDDYVRDFGFERLPGTRASGAVVIERFNPDNTSIYFPTGTEFRTSTAPQVRFYSVVPAVLGRGDTQITVPVQAINPGVQGNVEANRVDLLSAGTGIDSVSNPASMTGGTDPESDEDLRDRFKRTLLRHMAGTEAMFLGTALDNSRTTKAIVIGAEFGWQEQVQIVGGTATTGLDDDKYVYDDPIFLRSPDGNTVYTRGTHFDWDSAADPPTISIIDSGVVPDGLYVVDFNYLPVSSRNEPANGISNRVDVYVNGIEVASAVETLAFFESRAFTGTPADALHNEKFQRLDGTNPEVGNIFIGFTFGPVTQPTITGEIDIDGSTYTEGTDFFLVQDITANGGHPGSLSGIEWVSAANGGIAVPADGTVFSNDYYYNRVPSDIENAIQRWRLVGSDVKVHIGKPFRLNVHLVIIPQRGFSYEQIESDLIDEVGSLVQSLNFSDVVQVSDILSAASQVAGVDAVRFATTADDPTSYAMQRVAEDGTTVIQTYASGGRPIDIPLKTDEYAVLNDLVLTLRAQGTFGF